MMHKGFSLHQLSAGYRGRTVLHHIDLSPVPPGSLVALVGPNAVGKSTLIKAVAGLCATQGQVWLDDTDLSTLPAAVRLRHIGYLPQALPQPSSLLAYESWQSALHSSRSAWTAAQRETAIEDTVARMGLQALALRRMDELSGGQRQMVGLAQVIIRAPQLLLLDEPTSALDLRWQLLALQTLRDTVAHQGTTCIVAVHDLNLALRLCDHLLVLGAGGLRASGRPKDILSPALLREVYGIDARIETCSLGKPLVIADAVAQMAHIPHTHHHSRIHSP